MSAPTGKWEKARRQLLSHHIAAHPAPVVSDEEDALDPEGVEERHLVGDECLAVVSVPRCLGPAEATQIGCQQAVTGPQADDHPPPHVPVLRPPVEEEDRRLPSPARARLSDVDPSPFASTNRCSTPSTCGISSVIRCTLCTSRRPRITGWGVGSSGGEGAAEEPAGTAVRGAGPARAGESRAGGLAGGSARRSGPACDFAASTARDALLPRLSPGARDRADCAGCARGPGASRDDGLRSGANRGSAEPPTAVRRRRTK